VASGLIDALAAPIRDLQALIARPADPFAEPGAALRRARDALAELADAARRAWDRAGVAWSGAGAVGAAEFMAATVADIDALAARADRMSAATTAAAAAVARAHQRLQQILDEFEARAAALAPYLDDPAVVRALSAEARRSLAEAVGVVDALQADLTGHATALAPVAPTPQAPTPTTPAGFPAPAAPMLGSGASPEPAFGDLARLVSHAEPAPEAAAFGDGVAVRLPDGSIATAPNAVAASAVRHALTQLGVPYDWGGTTPGVGLDCSGLTQWAYGQAGLALPRLAQEQDVGAPVAMNELLPGDLAVWDGHVAMIVGNGMMIEAGDPVKLSPIRTTNAGQGFQGFWRPTA